jgi:hypothetical protein
VRYNGKARETAVFETIDYALAETPHDVTKIESERGSKQRQSSPSWRPALLRCPAVSSSLVTILSRSAEPCPFRVSIPGNIISRFFILFTEGK